jgi:hypothetical protein
MRKTSLHRALRAALTGFATAVVLIMVSRTAVMWDAQAPSFAFVPELFDGAAYGATAETAVRQAIGDAEVTASAYGLYTCELAEEPEVFQQPPDSLRAFRAHVRMRCKP